MHEGIPLHQILEPGEYRTRWTIPSRDGGEITLDGDLELIPDRPPRAHVYGEIPGTYDPIQDGSRTASFPQEYNGGLIRGQLLNGHHVLLVDTVIHVLFPDRASLQSRAALVGPTPAPEGELRIFRVEAQVEGLDAISGIAPIQRTEVPMQVPPGTRHLDWSWKAVGEPDSTQTWTDENTEVELRFYNSYSAVDWFAFRVTFSPIVLIRPSQPFTFDSAFSEWVEPLRRIISLSTGRRERLTFLSVDLGAGQDPPRFQVYGTALHQDPYASNGNDVGKVDRAFWLLPTDMSLLALLRRWQELSAEHHPLLETYGSLIYAHDQHPRSRLLLLLQAIEGLHGYETRTAHEERVFKHQAQRQEVLDVLEESQSAEIIAFLKKHLMKKPAVGLDEAVRQILKQAPIDVTPVLAASRLLVAHENVPAGLRIIRNDLAHGNRGYDAQDLREVVQPLEGVVRAHFLRVLGCTTTAQERAQE